MDNIRASRDRLNIQIRHSDLPLALREQRSNILVNVNEILTKTALENLKYMNIYNSLLRKKLCLSPSDPKMHCEPRGKLKMSTYPNNCVTAECAYPQISKMADNLIFLIKISYETRQTLNSVIEVYILFLSLFQIKP